MLGKEWSPVGLGLLGRSIGEDYEFELEGQDIGIGISAVDEYRGDVRAELRVFLITSRNMMGFARTQEDVVRARTTITGLTTKKQFATALSRDRRTAEVPIWSQIIERCCNTAIDAFRTGEPFLLLDDMEPPEHDGYLISDKFLPLGRPTLLFGDGESGKSLTALCMGLVVATGQRMPNMNLSGEPGPVVYLDYETTPGDQWKRLTQACRGLGIARPRNFWYRTMTRPLAYDVSALRRYAANEQPTLVICDSLGMACGGDPIDSQAVIRFFGALRALGITSLVLHHVSWQQAERTDGGLRPYGSVYGRNQARAAWALQRTSDRHSSKVRIMLEHNKSNDGSRFPNMGMDYIFTDDSFEVKWLDPSTEPEFQAKLPMTSQLRGLMLGGGKTTVRELHDATGASKNTIKSALRRMDDVDSEPGGGRGKETEYWIRAREDISF